MRKALRARVGNGWEALIAGTDTMQSRCSSSGRSSGTIASRPLPCLNPPRHTCRWTLPSSTSARFNFARRPPAVGQSYRARVSGKTKDSVRSEPPMPGEDHASRSARSWTGMLHVWGRPFQGTAPTGHAAMHMNSHETMLVHVQLVPG